MSWESINTEGGEGEGKEMKELKEGKGVERLERFERVNDDKVKLETWYCMHCTSANLAPIRPRLVGLEVASKEPERLCAVCGSDIPALLCATCEVEVIITIDMLSAGWVVCTLCDKSISLAELLNPHSESVKAENKKLALENTRSTAALKNTATSLSSTPVSSTSSTLSPVANVAISVEEMAKIGKQRREEKMAEIRKQMREEIRIKQIRREQGL